MRSSFRLVAASALALVTASCTSESTISTTAPGAAKCQVSVASSMSTAPSTGANGSVTVTTTRDCTWDAASGVNWIALTSTANGQGSGTISFRVEPNGVPASRKGAIDVNGTAVTVTQEAAPCRFTVSPLNSSVSASGANVTVTVDTLSGCSWTAASQAPWIHIASGASANASGPVAIAIDANSGSARSGTLTVAGQTVTINQAELPPTPAPPPAPPTPVPCSYTINPAAYSAPAVGATGSVAVTTTATCAWTATSNAGWITFTSVPSATGSGALGFSIVANAGAARSGTATIAGQTFTVTQAAAGCSYGISPASQSVDSSGGSGSFGVTASSWCSWTASVGAPWITVTSGGSGSGNGTVAFSVAANAGAARSSTITVGGQTFAISQAAAPPPPCTYSIAPPSQSIDSTGGTGTVAVTASSATCAWTAASNNPDWLTVTSGASGTGNGSVAFNAAANSGAARSGTITIASQTFTVSQAAAPPTCTFAISPMSQTLPLAGGGGTVAITASDPTCSWTAVSNAGWLTITSPASGNGSGSIAFTAAGDGDPGPRSGTLTVAGQTFTVTEQGS
jgi:Putative binding domain, N-terminal/Viral BACON domain